MLSEQCFETTDIFVATFAPTIGYGVGDITNFQVRNRGFGVVDVRHRPFSLKQVSTSALRLQTSHPTPARNFVERLLRLRYSTAGSTPHPADVLAAQQGTELEYECRAGIYPVWTAQHRRRTVADRV